MITALPIEPRWVVGVVVVLVFAGLIVEGSVSSEVGVGVITTILGALGLYERQGRVNRDRQLNELSDDDS